MKTIIQVIESTIASQGQTVRITAELDQRFEMLTGIAFLDNISGKSILVSSDIDGNELFPGGFEVAFLQSSINVPPNLRFFTLQGKKAAGRKFNLDFKDGGVAPAYPYTFHVYLRLQNNE